MRLERKHRQLIVLGMGIIILLFGLLQAILKFDMDSKITDEAVFVLMIIAAALLFAGDKKKGEDNYIAGAVKGHDRIEPEKNKDGETGKNSESINDNITTGEKESVNKNEQSDRNH